MAIQPANEPTIPSRNLVLSSMPKAFNARFASFKYYVWQILRNKCKKYSSEFRRDHFYGRLLAFFKNGSVFVHFSDNESYMYFAQVLYLQQCQLR